VQATPLRLNDDGAAGSPVWVAWKPMPIEPPAGIAALYATFLAVTCPEDLTP